MKTALIIEDNENNMALMCFILEHHGFRVLRAVTGRSGVEMSKSADYDFILLDIQLPDIDGLEVLRQVREAGITKPVIAVTSHAMTGDRARLLAAGCNGYLEKPIDPARIIDQIHANLGTER
ncbi:MAG: response regulator [Gammaproteobacteria bacterium]